MRICRNRVLITIGKLHLNYVRKAIIGFAYGLGFAIAFILLNLIVAKIGAWRGQAINYAELEKRGAIEQSIWFSEFVVEDQGMIMNDRGPEIMVTIANNSDKNAKWLFVKTDLYNKAGKFIYQCDGQLRQLAPYSKKNLKIQCDLRYSEETRKLRESIYTQDSFIYEAME